MAVAIATTTIFPVGQFLESYSANLRKFGREKDVTIYIAGDRKSPPDSGEVAQQFCKEGFQIEFMDITYQRDYLGRFPDLAAIIPENSDNRRNVAYLRALEEGADVVISVDDDNFPVPDVDFVDEHLHVGRKLTLPEAVGYNNWYNLCDLLEPKIPGLYPRGFPYWARHKDTGRVKGTTTGQVGINVGLWKGDPDTDAIGRLYCAPHIKGDRGIAVMLGTEVRSPINTQNTGLSRQVMAVYYYIRMGDKLCGMYLDRFGDIFSGYFAQACVAAVGERIRIGSPVADHRRNQHNLLVDLYHELAGIMVLEDLSRFLVDVQLPHDSYLSAYRALSAELEGFTDNAEGFIWQPETKKYFHKIGSYMRIWADVVADII